MKYTIKQIMPTGKNSQMYGVEYHVQFNEIETVFPMWFKAEPKPGQEVEGEIAANGKFKKAKKQWQGNEAGNSQSGTSQSQSSPSRPPYKDNSLGMRIGMCINNAAAYVNTLEFKKPLTDSEWAQTVIAYGKALFVLSDDKAFTEAPEGSQAAPVDEPAQSVAQVFGPGTEVVNP